MIFRPIEEKDFEQCLALYEEEIYNEETYGVQPGWKRGVYPTINDIKAGYEQKDMYVIEDEGIVAAGRINHVVPEFYHQLEWTENAPDGKVLVLHALCVKPGAVKKGYGREFVNQYRKMAKEQNCVIHFDATVTNTGAISFYNRLGFRQVGKLSAPVEGIGVLTFIGYEDGTL